MADAVRQLSGKVEMLKLSLFFAWYDFWIGAFYDRQKRILYICPLPMIVVKIAFGR